MKIQIVTTDGRVYECPVVDGLVEVGGKLIAARDHRTLIKALKLKQTQVSQIRMIKEVGE